MKKIVPYALILAVLVSGISLGVTYAGSEQDQLENINSQINQTQKQLNEGKKKEQQLNKQIKNLEHKLQTTIDLQKKLEQQ